MSLEQKLEQLTDQLAECPEYGEQVGWSVKTGIVKVSTDLLLLAQQLQKQNLELLVKNNKLKEVNRMLMLMDAVQKD